MALINCPECGKEISDKSVACPHCGFPIESESITNNTELPKVEPKTSTNTNPEKSDNSCIGCIIIIAILILLSALGSGDTNYYDGHFNYYCNVCGNPLSDLTYYYNGPYCNRHKKWFLLILGKNHYVMER